MTTATASRPRVLLVDDDPRILAGLRRQLHRQYDVVTAPGGAEGLAAVAGGEQFAVVVSDMRMPGMDGATFLAQVRATTPQTTRILLTGQTELSTAIRAINDGQVFRFLDKPCPPEVLDQALRDAVNRYQAACDENRLLASALADRRVTEDTASAELTAEPQVGTHNAEYQVRYQPIVELATGRVTAVQAMLGGAPEPAEPGPAPPPLEPTISLRQWVMAAACQEVASWPAISATGHLRVHLRLTAGYLADPVVTDDLARTLVLSGLRPERLVVEAADTTPADDPQIQRALRAIVAWGVNLHIVRTSPDPVPPAIGGLPFHGVKVSGPDLLDAPGSLIPGLFTTIDGVRTYDQHQRAVDAGCDAAQGPYYGEDADPGHLLTHLANIRLP